MDLSKRKKELQKEFDTLQETRKGILNEAKKLQQKLTAIDSRTQQVQGAYNMLVELETPKEGDESKIKSEKPKKA